VATAVTINDRPSAFRYPRGEGTGIALPTVGEVFTLGKGRVLREGNNIAILSLGSRLGDALKAADQLAARGFRTTVADARFAKPIDAALVEQLARHHEVLITVEEASVGGFSAQVMQHLAWKGMLDSGLKIRPMVMPDRFIDHDSQTKQLADAGLSAKDIVSTALSAIGAEMPDTRSTPNPHSTRVITSR
jgi:1-deoxy-D-xylulose-5-phosphate synthase